MSNKIKLYLCNGNTGSFRSIKQIINIMEGKALKRNYPIAIRKSNMDNVPLVLERIFGEDIYNKGVVVLEIIEATYEQMLEIKNMFIDEFILSFEYFADSFILILKSDKVVDKKSKEAATEEYVNILKSKGYRPYSMKYCFYLTPKRIIRNEVY